MKDSKNTKAGKEPKKHIAWCELMKKKNWDRFQKDKMLLWHLF